MGCHKGFNQFMKLINQPLTFSQFIIISPAAIAIPPMINPIGLVIIATLKALMPRATNLKALFNAPKTKPNAFKALV